MARFAVMDIERWKRAVVHLEGAADSEQAVTIRDAIWQASRDIDDPAEWQELMRHMPTGRDMRARGTAIFLRHEGSRFLVTARHVLHDPRMAEAHMRKLDMPVSPEAPEWWQQETERLRREREELYIHPVIFRVPTLDEALRASSPSDVDQEFLMNLSAGGPSMAPYTYSVPEIDLAIISLDQRTGMGRAFADDLEASGHVPVDSSVLASAVPGDGTEVMAVGYPDSVSVLGQRPRTEATAHWSSSHVSLPVVSFGKVAMVHNALPFLWADISIYPGNSGGPLVEGDRLAGIVSQQATVPVEGVEGTDAGDVRIPFARVIRAELLTQLLHEQLRKDQHDAR